MRPGGIFERVRRSVVPDEPTAHEVAEANRVEKTVKKRRAANKRARAARARNRRQR